MLSIEHITPLTQNKVRAAFSDENTRAYVATYLEALRSNLDTLESNFRRTLLLLCLLGVIYLLLTEASITEANLGPFKIADLTIIQRLFPVAIAYTFFELCSQCVARGILRNTFRALYKEYYSPLHQAHLDEYLIPTSPWLTEDIVHLERNRGLFTYVFIPIRLVYGFLIIVGGLLAFGYYAIVSVEVFLAGDTTSLEDILGLVASIVSAVLYLQSLMVIFKSDEYDF